MIFDLLAVDFSQKDVLFGSVEPSGHEATHVGDLGFGVLWLIDDFRNVFFEDYASVAFLDGKCYGGAFGATLVLVSVVEDLVGDLLELFVLGQLALFLVSRMMAVIIRAVAAIWMIMMVKVLNLDLFGIDLQSIVMLLDFIPSLCDEGRAL